MRALRRLAARLQNRRGATLVLVSVLMVSLVGMTGVAVDMSRLYAFKAQLQVSADAGALAAITEVSLNDPGKGTQQGLTYVANNTVDGYHVPEADSLDVEPGIYNFDTKQFEPNGYQWNASVTAVRVTATYPAPLVFGGLIGKSTTTLTARAVAARGYVGAADCVKPWAVSYRTMLDWLYPPGHPSYPMPITHDLTAAEIGRLAAGDGAPMTLLNDNSQPNTPGNIAQVKTYPGSGNNEYRNAITGCSPIPIAPGDTIYTDTGAGAGQTQNAVKDFCDASGGTTGNAQSFTCLGQPKVKLIIWDTNNGLSGANLEYYVKYIGVFKIQNFSKVPGGTYQISGSFSSMASSGGFSSTPTPIIKPGGVIVQ